MRIQLLAAAAAFLATAAFAQDFPPEMSPEGAGPVRIGMPAEEALAITPTPVAGGYGDPAECEVYQLHDGQAFWFMIEGGKVVRTTAGIGGATVEGLNVGDPEARVRELYPVVEERPAPYAEPPAHDLYWWRAPDSGLRFEIDDMGAVKTIHAGGPAIQYVEGCL